MNDFDKVYISWATNLLPEEIDLDNAYIKRENEVHYLGTISAHGICENASNFTPFVNACHKNGIKFIHNDPWVRPLSSDEVIKRTQRSLLGIDIRGPQHLKQRLLTCRVFKNISYGHLGLTNSEEIFNELDGNCLYSQNTEMLFYEGLDKSKDYEFVRTAMLFVKENHTYINRVKALISIL